MISKKHVLLLSVVLLFTSCVNNVDEVKSYQKLSTPDYTFKGVKSLRSVEGVVELEMESAVINYYEGDNARTEYPKGIFMKFFNSDKSLKATLSAKYAVDNTAKRMMEARNNVIMIDYRTGDTIYTEGVTWDRTTKRIFSDKMIKQVNGRNVTYGDGFVANEQLDSMVIKGQRGIQPFKENED